MSGQRSPWSQMSFIKALGSFSVHVSATNNARQLSRNATGCRASSIMRPYVLAVDGVHAPNMSPSTLKWPQLLVVSVTLRIAFQILKTCWWTSLAFAGGGTAWAACCSRAVMAAALRLPDGYATCCKQTNSSWSVIDRTRWSG